MRYLTTIVIVVVGECTPFLDGLSAHGAIGIGTTARAKDSGEAEVCGCGMAMCSAHLAKIAQTSTAFGIDKSKDSTFWA
jgi:hypothetical protein